MFKKKKAKLHIWSLTFFMFQVGPLRLKKSS